MFLCAYWKLFHLILGWWISTIFCQWPSSLIFFCFTNKYRCQNYGAIVWYPSLMEHIWKWMHGYSLIPAYFKGNLHIHIMLWLLRSSIFPLPVDLSCKLFASRICLLHPDKMYTVGSCRISRVRLKLSQSRRVWLSMNTHGRIQLCTPNY